MQHLSREDRHTTREPTQLLPDIIVPPEATAAALADLGARLRDVLEKHRDFRVGNEPTQAPIANPIVLDALKSENVRLLLACGVLGSADQRLVWNFVPFAADDLVLFHDPESRRFEREYVWLRDKRDSGSWLLMDTERIIPGMSVLDLGCGSGLNALRATRSGASATGVDINRRAVRVARFNQLINGVYDAFFVHSDWNSFSGSDYDLTVSQPPFDPDLPGCAPVYAWLGGGCFGLRYTCELIERFCPRVPGARMTLYVHSFATSNGPLLQELLPGCVGDGCASSFELLRSNTLSSWWSKYRERHRLEDSCPIPAEWSSVEFVGAYVVRITKM